MNLKNIYKKYISKYIGNIEYVVTTVNVSGEVSICTFHTIKEVDDCVISINNQQYWFVQKIEKFRRYTLNYDKIVIHTPLHFRLENVTEMYKINDYDFSFIKIDKSLTNVTRQDTK